MSDQIFNLVRDPWIPVRIMGETRMLSLLEIFDRAKDIEFIEAELETVNFAILRLLLAILYRVIQEDDKDFLFDTLQQALAFWKEVWETESFGSLGIEDYLRSVEDRFNLVDEKYPAFQVTQRVYDPAIKRDKPPTYPVKKLYSDLSESNNKIKLFQNRGENKNQIDYQDVPRWILHLMYFDDVAAKLGTGVGWLGKCTPVYARGRNLFETLLLNLVLFDIRAQEPYPTGLPSWEEDRNLDKQNEIFQPESPVSLLTYWSRKIGLVFDSDGKILGFDEIGSDYFDIEDVYIENYTIFKETDKKNENSPIKPAQPTAAIRARQFWREMENVFLPADNKEKLRPGVVKWLGLLHERKVIDTDQCQFQTCASFYGSSNSSIAEITSDSISFRPQLISDLNTARKTILLKELGKVDQIAKSYADLSAKAVLLLGLRSADSTGSEKRKSNRERAFQEAYQALDRVTRDFLEVIDPNEPDAYKNWNILLSKEGKRLARELSERLPARSFFYTKIKQNGEEKLISYSDIYFEYLGVLKKIVDQG